MDCNKKNQWKILEFRFKTGSTTTFGQCKYSLILFFVFEHKILKNNFFFLQEDELINYFTNELQSKDKELFIVQKINSQHNNIVVQLDEEIDLETTKTSNKSKSQQKQSQKICL